MPVSKYVDVPVDLETDENGEFTALRRFLVQLIEQLDTQQSSISNISLTSISPSATYSQEEITQLANDVKSLSDKTDEILNALRGAGIL